MSHLPFYPTWSSDCGNTGEPGHPQKLPKASVKTVALAQSHRHTHAMPGGMTPIICLLSACGHTDQAQKITVIRSHVFALNISPNRGTQPEASGI